MAGIRHPSGTATQAPRESAKWGFMPSFLPARDANRPSDDLIFALNKEASQRRSRGESIVNATVGAMLEDDGTLATFPTVVEALRSVPPARGAAYAPIAGHGDFLAAVIEDLLGGTPLAEQAAAVATPGGTGALRHAVATFLERGQALLTSSFYWGPYKTICDGHERELVTFNMFDAAGRFDVAALEKALADTAKAQGRLLVFLNDPCHNPTGYSLSDEEWGAAAAAMGAAAARVPLAILVDVAYMAFARQERRHFLERLAPLTERALVLFAWSASKSFGCYGLRVGALIACTADAAEREAIRNALTYGCRATWSNCNAAGQLAITRCIVDPPLRDKVRGERDRLRDLLGARVDAWNDAAHAAKLRFPRYEGGFFVTVFTPDAQGAANRLKEAGVYVVPQTGALRVALCSVPAADVPRLVSAISGAIHS